MDRESTTAPEVTSEPQTSELSSPQPARPVFHVQVPREDPKRLIGVPRRRSVPPPVLLPEPRPQGKFEKLTDAVLRRAELRIDARTYAGSAMDLNRAFEAEDAIRSAQLRSASVAEVAAVPVYDITCEGEGCGRVFQVRGNPTTRLCHGCTVEKDRQVQRAYRARVRGGGEAGPVEPSHG